MIGWEDVYKIVVVMVPLYVALGLGYGSAKCWRMFRPEQCDAVNRFNAYVVIPFFIFEFTHNIDPYHMNYKFLAADVVAKAIIGATLALWATLSKEANLPSAITAFSIATMSNTLVIGVPLLEAMYGSLGKDLVVQSSVIQFLLWCPLLLFMLEFKHTLDNNSNKRNPRERLCSAETMPTMDHNASDTSSGAKHDSLLEDPTTAKTSEISAISPSYSFRSTMKKVWANLAKNPNNYACALGLIWALLARRRWNFEMPSIVDGSIQIMAKAGSGVPVFSIGLFMALQKKVMVCSVRSATCSMALRFVGGPLTMAVGALALGLRADILRIVFIQAALPHAIISFVFAQEHGVHANLLSTSVIFGTIISLPLLIACYAVLDVLH